MASQNRINMPSGMGGLVRYFDEYKSRFRLSPGNIIIIIVIVVLIEFFLHWQGYSLLGLR